MNEYKFVYIQWQLLQTKFLDLPLKLSNSELVSLRTFHSHFVEENPIECFEGVNRPSIRHANQ